MTHAVLSMRWLSQVELPQPFCTPPVCPAPAAQSLCVHGALLALCQPTVARASARAEPHRPCSCLQPPRRRSQARCRRQASRRGSPGIGSANGRQLAGPFAGFCAALASSVLATRSAGVERPWRRLACRRHRLGCRCAAACPPMLAAQPACMALSEAPKWALSSSLCGWAAASLAYRMVQVARLSCPPQHNIAAASFPLGYAVFPFVCFPITTMQKSPQVVSLRTQPVAQRPPHFPEVPTAGVVK